MKKNRGEGVEKRNRGDRREGRKTPPTVATTLAASAAASVATAPGNFLPSPVVF
jgi:hypothetical protein